MSASHSANATAARTFQDCKADCREKSTQRESTPTTRNSARALPAVLTAVPTEGLNISPRRRAIKGLFHFSYPPNKPRLPLNNPPGSSCPQVRYRAVNRLRRMDCRWDKRTVVPLYTPRGAWPSDAVRSGETAACWADAPLHQDLSPRRSGAHTCLRAWGCVRVPS